MDDVQRYAGCNHWVGRDFHLAVGNEVVELRHGRSRWFVEWHHYFGPIACSKSGDPKPRQPGEKSKFWFVAQLWKDQGCRVIDGVGQWQMPQPVKTGEWFQVGRRLYPLDLVDGLVMSDAAKDGGRVVEVWECPGYEHWVRPEIREKTG